MNPRPFVSPFGRVRNFLLGHRCQNRQAQPYPHQHETNSLLLPNRVSRIPSTLLDDTLDYNGNLAWTIDFATAYALRHIQVNRNQVSDALQEVANLRMSCSHPEEYPYLVFDILDTALFDGKLNDMVYLEWYESDPSTAGQTSAPLVKKPRITIQLNRRYFTTYGLVEILALVVHHMIHAYFLVCCGPQAADNRRDSRLIDGLHFGVLLYHIKEIADISGTTIPWTPSRGHLSSISNPGIHDTDSYLEQYLRPEREPAQGITYDRLSSLTYETTDCSHDCHVTARQCKEWPAFEYARAIEKKEDEQGRFVMRLGIFKLTACDRLKECPPSTEYFELLWEKQRIMVTKSKALRHAASLKARITNKDRKPIKLPQCDYESMERVVNYLEKGTSRPEVLRHQPSSSSNSSAVQGPVLLDIQAGWPDLFLTDIRLHKIACEMEFSELQAHALSHLSQRQYTHADPIAALVLLYDEDPTKTIHDDLRRWSRSFLSGTSHSSSESTSSTNSSNDFLPSRHETMRDSTLFKLKHSAHSAAYLRLYARNANFRQDVDFARSQLLTRLKTQPASRAPPRGSGGIVPGRAPWSLPHRNVLDGTWEIRHDSTGESMVRMVEGGEWVPCIRRGPSLLNVVVEETQDGMGRGGDRRGCTGLDELFERRRQRS